MTSADELRELLKNDPLQKSRRDFLERRLEERDRMRQLANSLAEHVVKIKRYPGDLFTAETVKTLNSAAGILHIRDGDSAYLEDAIYPNYRPNLGWWYGDIEMAYMPQSDILIESSQYNERIKTGPGMWVCGYFSKEPWARDEVVELEKLEYNPDEWRERVKEALLISGYNERPSERVTLPFKPLKQIFQGIISKAIL